MSELSSRTKLSEACALSNVLRLSSAGPVPPICVTVLEGRGGVCGVLVFLIAFSTFAIFCL